MLRSNRLFVFLLVLLIPASLRGQAVTIDSARALIGAGRWGEAAAAWESIARQDSTHGEAWYRLGMARQALKDYPAAVRAFRRAQELGFQPLGADYRLARVYALTGRDDSAFAHLQKLADGGFGQTALVADEKDFASLRDRARLARLVEQIRGNQYPCHAREEAKQFDFWIGKWNVTVGGRQAGVNEVYPILEHCVIYENWSGAQGGNGKSFNFWDAQRNHWRQVWVADGGNVLEYTGEYRDGAMRFEGFTLTASGDTVLQKLTFFNVAPDTVRQLFEASQDGGQTWQATFDGLYVKAANSE